MSKASYLLLSISQHVEKGRVTIPEVRKVQGRTGFHEQCHHLQIPLIVSTSSDHHSTN